MSPLAWKLLPWGIAGVGIVASLLLFGAAQEAKGRAKASVESADRLQVKVTADSTVNAAAQRVRDDSLASLERTVAAARVVQKVAAKGADSAAASLRATLDTRQAVQLDALVAAHDRERAGWAQEQMAAAATLRLRTEERDVALRDAADLRQINASLRAATVAGARTGGPSIVQRFAPYALAALGVAKVAGKL